MFLFYFFKAKAQNVTVVFKNIFFLPPDVILTAWAGSSEARDFQSSVQRSFVEKYIQTDKNSGSGQSVKRHPSCQTDEYLAFSGL